jgi:hypothetical protein
MFFLSKLNIPIIRICQAEVWSEQLKDWQVQLKNLLYDPKKPRQFISVNPNILYANHIALLESGEEEVNKQLIASQQVLKVEEIKDEYDIKTNQNEEEINRL